MLHKLNQDDESLLDGLYQEHFGPTIAAMPGDARIWKTAKTDVLQTGDLDSMDRVEFIMAVEETFHVEIPDSIATQIDTKDHLATFLGEILDTKRRDPN